LPSSAASPGKQTFSDNEILKLCETAVIRSLRFSIAEKVVNSATFPHDPSQGTIVDLPPAASAAAAGAAPAAPAAATGMAALGNAFGTAPPGDPQAASIIEVLVLDRLMPSLRLGFHYVLTVAAQRHPSLFLRLHRFRDEAYLVFAAVLEAHSLAHNGASFSEHFYGLCREPTSARSGAVLSRLALLLLLLPPYLRSKIDEHFEQHERSPDQADDEQDGAVGGGEAAAPDGEQPRVRPRSEASPSLGVRHLGRRLVRFVCRLLCASLDASALAQLLLFMHGRSPHATLSQRLLGFRLKRAQPADHTRARAATTTASTSSASSAAAAVGYGASSPPSSSFDSFDGWLAALEQMRALAEMPLRHARQLLVLSVFG
jgi:hypothetical protein